MSLHMTGKHRTTGYEYGWYVDSGCCHQKSRYILITVRNHDKCIKLMCNCHTLGRICDQVSCYKGILHSDMSHGNTVADSDCREHHRCSACFSHAKLHGLCDLIQVHMSGYDLVVGTNDTDQWFLHFFFCHSKGVEQASVWCLLHAYFNIITLHFCLPFSSICSDNFEICIPATYILIPFILYTMY